MDPTQEGPSSGDFGRATATTTATATGIDLVLASGVDSLLVSGFGQFDVTALNAINHTCE